MVMARSRKILKYWFLIAVLVVIFIAEIVPHLTADGGLPWPDTSAKYGTVPIVFLLSGLTLPTDNLLTAAKQYDLHFVTQCFSLLFTPLFVKLLTVVLAPTGVDDWIMKGFIISSSMPVSSSSVVATICADGNEAAAIVNCIVGALLGMITTPLILLILIRSAAVVSPVKSLHDLILTVGIPLLVGQIVRKVTGMRLQHSIALKIRQLALLMTVFITFCDIFMSHLDVELQPINVLVSVFSVVILQMTLLLLIFWTTRYLPSKFSLQDTKAIMFCSTHKSLSLGIPILRTMYSGYGHLYSASLPLLLYYPSQIILGELLGQHMKNWVNWDSGHDK
ncbi:sodium/bile acid cotransporter 7-like isoform X1 [Schistocerca serialis cubense]|uniref:sodium/bile acid cotransporter 7-like isoform X1 n=1 Tax=Schistocerca serialis cubense TaxID=2023355 RepID=UPI00214E2AC9|nr:sodium/bile acid cotransporter 7-like isoform X1 [Schistocerca serialis cubense]